MRRHVLSIAALFVTGIAINAFACDCGCKAPKAKPPACPASNCTKSEAKSCPASTCAKTADKACTTGDCARPAVKKACQTACKKACCAVAPAAGHGYDVIDTTGLKKLLSSDQKVTIVDARSGKWDDGRRIGNAQQLAANASADEIAKALPNKDAKIVAYCTSTKCPASATLAHKLVDLGYKNVVKYPAGVDGWQAAGNAVNNTK